MKIPNAIYSGKKEAFSAPLDSGKRNGKAQRGRLFPSYQVYFP
jgi:hypothetical protein